MPDHLIRGTDTGFEQYIQGVPPDRFVAVLTGFMPDNHTVSLILLPSNGLRVEEREVRDALANERRIFTCRDVNAIWREAYDTSRPERRRAVCSAYTALAAHGIRCRLGVTLEHLVGAHHAYTWKIAEGNSRIQEMLLADAAQVPAPAAPRNGGVLTAETIADAMASIMAFNPQPAGMVVSPRMRDALEHMMGPRPTTVTVRTPELLHPGDAVCVNAAGEVVAPRPAGGPPVGRVIESLEHINNNGERFCEARIQFPPEQPVTPADDRELMAQINDFNARSMTSMPDRWPQSG